MTKRLIFTLKIVHNTSPYMYSLKKIFVFKHFIVKYVILGIGPYNAMIYYAELLLRIKACERKLKYVLKSKQHVKYNASKSKTVSLEFISMVSFFTKPMPLTV